MQNLGQFIKSSTAIDFAFIFLVLFIAFVLIPAAIVMVIKARRRKPMYLLLGISLLPLVLALLGASWRIYRQERLLDDYPEVLADAASTYRQEFRREFLIMSTIGLAGTAIPFLIGVLGLVMKKSER